MCVYISIPIDVFLQHACSAWFLRASYTDILDVCSNVLAAHDLCVGGVHAASSRQLTAGRQIWHFTGLYMCVFACMCVRACVCVRMSVFVWVCVCMCECVCACVCIICAINHTNLWGYMCACVPFVFLFCMLDLGTTFYASIWPDVINVVSWTPLLFKFSTRCLLLSQSRPKMLLTFTCKA